MNGYLLAFILLVLLAGAFLFIIRDAITLDKTKAADALRAVFTRTPPK